MKKSYRYLTLLLALIFIAAALAGCTAPRKLPGGAAENDILTYEPNTEDKRVIRIGMQYYAPDTSLIDFLRDKFPDYVFVLDYSAAAGVGSENRLVSSIDSGEDYDFIITGSTGFASTASDRFVDLSAERFLDNYLLSSLNNISIDGRISFLPGTSVLVGIAYNKDMFEANSWEVPATVDEFFELCAKIQAAGVKPFANCCKYATQVTRLLDTMCYNELFYSYDDLEWVAQVERGEAGFSGHLEPLYELAKRFCDNGVIVLDDFSASLTKQRQAFWAGEYAMFFATTDVFTYAESEGATIDVGIMPFPAFEAENAGYCTLPAYYLAIPARVAEDQERLDAVLDIFTYLSTPEGQAALLANSFSISNVKGVDMTANPAFEYFREAYERGNMYPDIAFTNAPFSIAELVKHTVMTMFEGGSAEAAIALADEQILNYEPGDAIEPPPERVCTAESDFTVLETSYYIADVFREIADTDIALMPNRSFFRGNLTKLYAGEINNRMDMFAMKGVTAEDRLTVYTLTGAQLRRVLEYPYINGVDVDCFIAASGLAVKYAPWNERGSRVLSVALEDGTPIDDAAAYSVAAWTGVIPEDCITETVAVLTDLGDLSAIMLTALTADGADGGSIAPDIADRVTLVWE